MKFGACCCIYAKHIPEQWVRGSLRVLCVPHCTVYVIHGGQKLHFKLCNDEQARCSTKYHVRYALADEQKYCRILLITEISDIIDTGMMMKIKTMHIPGTRGRSQVL